MLAHARFIDLPVRQDKPLRLPGGQDLQSSASGRSGFSRTGQALEEESHGHIEDRGDLVQPAADELVGAALVFLDLLESEPDGTGEICLGHAEPHAALAQAQPDMQIDLTISQSAPPNSRLVLQVLLTSA